MIFTVFGVCLLLCLSVTDVTTHLSRFITFLWCMDVLRRAGTVQWSTSWKAQLRAVKIHVYIRGMSSHSTYFSRNHSGDGSFHWKVQFYCSKWYDLIYLICDMILKLLKKKHSGEAKLKDSKCKLTSLTAILLKNPKWQVCKCESTQLQCTAEQI